MIHKRILIIQTAFIGDVVLSTPLVRNLRKIFPDSFLSFLLIPETKNVLENNPHLNQILVYDKRKKRGMGEFIRVLREIRNGQFDLALIPHRSMRSALLARLSGIPGRIGFDKSTGSYFLTSKVGYRAEIHEVDRNLSLLSSLSPRLTDASPGLFPSPEDFSYVRQLLTHRDIREGDRIVGIAPGSVWATKRWLPERFAEVSQLLMDKAGAKIVFIGSGDDRDLCYGIGSSMKGKPAILAGSTSILQSAAMVSLCKAILSNDSAPVHIASAMKTPVVAIFGSTVPEFGFGPYGVKHVVLQKDVYCRPCGIHGRRKCPEKHFRCMREITTQEVFEALSSLL
jgi:heptosyltransferase-2